MTDAVGQTLACYGGQGDHGAGERHFLRFGFTNAEDRHFDRGSGIALEDELGEGEGHIASGDRIDGLDHVAGGETFAFFVLLFEQCAQYIVKT